MLHAMPGKMAPCLTMDICAAAGLFFGGLLFHSTMLAVVGGWMRVESTAGQGTSVIIVVPEPALAVAV